MVVREPHLEVQALSRSGVFGRGFVRENHQTKLNFREGHPSKWVQLLELQNIPEKGTPKETFPHEGSKQLQKAWAFTWCSRRRISGPARFLDRRYVSPFGLMVSMGPLGFPPGKPPALCARGLW